MGKARLKSAWKLVLRDAKYVIGGCVTGMLLGLIGSVPTKATYIGWVCGLVGVNLLVFCLHYFVSVGEGGEEL